MDKMLEKTKTIRADLIFKSNWSIDMIIRYFYVKLAPYFKRDLNYYLVSREEQKKQYEEGFVFTGPEINCKTICDFYFVLYTELGIKCEKIVTNNKLVPHYALIIEGEKGWYYIDPLKDLLANQLGLKTQFFARTPKSDYSTVTSNYPFLIEFTEEEIKNLDKFTGLLPNGVYMNSFFELLKKEYNDNNVFSRLFNINKSNYLEIMLKKIEYAEAHLINIGKIPGIYERKQYYEYLKNIVFNRNERKFIEIYFGKVGMNHNVSVDISFTNNFEGTYTFTEHYSKKTGYYLTKIFR